LLSMWRKASTENEKQTWRSRCSICCNMDSRRSPRSRPIAHFISRC
jgi:hypothetical protein